MGKPVTVILVAMIFLALPFAGCLEEEVAEKKKIDAEELIEVENPCSMPSEPIMQSMTTIQAHGVDRYFGLTQSQAQKWDRIADRLGLHGGGGAEEDFPQQDEFDALAEEEVHYGLRHCRRRSRTESRG